MKRQIEIDDTLQEHVEDVKVDVKERFDEIVEDNIYQDMVDIVSEIADSNTPIYYHEIDGLHFLYGDELREAYEDAGCSRERPGNYRQVCIYFYLEEKAYEYLRELQTEFKEAANNETGD